LVGSTSAGGGVDDNAWAERLVNYWSIFITHSLFGRFSIIRSCSYIFGFQLARRRRAI
jgi:hypothetical protein